MREADFEVASDRALQATGIRVPSPEFSAVLDRATRYAVRYLDQLSGVVAEEIYEQFVGTGRNESFRQMSRALRSDFLLVRAAGQPGLTPFRDVFEVDGRPVRDRAERLTRLFLQNPATAMDAARRVLDEGARYNIGHVLRNINHAVLPLMFLLPDMRHRFVFEAADEPAADGAVRIDYRETGRPTLVQSGRLRGDLPASGSFWIQPGTGAVLVSVLKTGDRTFSMEATVVYRDDAEMAMLVPTEMRELYTVTADRTPRRPEQITGRAVYNHFRRFRVTTDETIRIPKID